jgi:hypothetical protein
VISVTGNGKDAVYFCDMPFVASSPYLDNYFADESHFCQLYPLFIQKLDKAHWSPLIVAYKASQFLAEKNDVKILDIGSGAGKFCLAGAYYKPNAFYCGVEQRGYLVDFASSAKEKLGRMKVEFRHKNFTQINFTEFDHFYFYNSFFENLEGAEKLDDSIEHSEELFTYYNRYLSRKLHERPAGTRVVTYRSLCFEIPSCYELVNAQMNNDLKFWIRK